MARRRPRGPHRCGGAVHTPSTLPRSPTRRPPPPTCRPPRSTLSPQPPDALYTQALSSPHARPRTRIVNDRPVAHVNARVPKANEAVLPAAPTPHHQVVPAGHGRRHGGGGAAAEEGRLGVPHPRGTWEQNRKKKNSRPTPSCPPPGAPVPSPPHRGGRRAGGAAGRAGGPTKGAGGGVRPDGRGPSGRVATAARRVRGGDGMTTGRRGTHGAQGEEGGEGRG